LIMAGLVLLCLGVVTSLLPRGVSLFAWFGKLPGDIYYQSDRIVIWIPITSMLVVSMLLSVVSWLIQRLLK
jgi:hypothetical protein